MSNAYQAISQFCANLGKDRLLVQGAGGNVSYKDDGVLWIKGSGTWLANADVEDIFVPVDLVGLQNALTKARFDFKPEVLASHAKKKLMPSIETVLHALMPQKFVVHLHAVDALSYLVTRNCKTILQERLTQAANKHFINSIFVDYHKPGPELAKAIYRALAINPNANVVLLKNHGIVIGAGSIDEIIALLQSIQAICTPIHNPSSTRWAGVNQVSASPEYIPFAHREVQALALKPCLYKRLQSDWALFPDHVVFLGSKAFTYSSWAAFDEQEKIHVDKPELIFIENTGVFVKPGFNQAKTAQLLCYFDVLVRISPNEELEVLSAIEIKALLHWDAEEYRRKMMK